MTQEVINYRFRPRRAMAATWAALNDVLLDQEFGVEKDTGRMKLGPGAWNSLPYWEGRPVQIDSEPQDGQSLAFNASTGLLEWRDTGKVYQPGTGIAIANPNTSTPTISSTLGSIAVTNDVADYASLPTNLTTADAGQYWVTRDTRMAYRWDGSAWPDEGDGVSLGGSRAKKTVVYCNTTNAVLMPAASVGPGMHAFKNFDTVYADDRGNWDATRHCFVVSEPGWYSIRNAIRANQNTTMEVLIAISPASTGYTYTTDILSNVYPGTYAIADSLIGNNYISMAASAMWGPLDVGDCIIPAIYSPVQLTQHSIRGPHYGLQVVGPL